MCLADRQGFGVHAGRRAREVRACRSGQPPVAAQPSPAGVPASSMLSTFLQDGFHSSFLHVLGGHKALGRCMQRVVRVLIIVRWPNC